MRIKIKCKDCGDEVEKEISDPNDLKDRTRLENLLCETCAKAPKEECD